MCYYDIICRSNTVVIENSGVLNPGDILSAYSFLTIYT